MSNVPRKLLSDNFLGEAFDIGLQLYGSGQAVVQDYLLTGNVLWDNGSPTGTNVDQIVIAGGGASKRNIELDTNFVYNSGGSGYSRVGWQWDALNGDVNLHGNWFVGGYHALEVWHWSPVSFHNNFLCGGPGNQDLFVGLYQPANQTPAQYSWDQNRYCGGAVVYSQTTLDASGNAVYLSATNGTPAAFQAATGFDTNATFGLRPTTGANVFVRPNKYEVGRANIVIFNWARAAAVSVDLSPAGLHDGDSWVIRDVQNFNAPPVASGVYASTNPAVMVPMANLTKAPIAGWSSTSPHTVGLGTFILIGGAALSGGGQPPTDNVPPTAAITSPIVNQNVSGSLTITATASDNVGVTGLQFKIDGSNLGGLVAAPYQINWNTAAFGNGPHSITAVAFDAANNQGSSSPVPVIVNNSTAPPGPSTPSSATYIKQDGSTQGNWKNTYGQDGGLIANDLNSPPAYAQVSFSNALLYTWAGSTTDIRALQSLSGGRISSTWYQSNSFTVDVNFTDGHAHQIAFYLLDDDRLSRVERIDVVDASSGTLLDTRTPNSYGPGYYLVWSVSGHVQFKLTKIGGPNAVVSGIFFGGATAAPPPTPGDTTPPTASMTYPLANQTVSNTVAVITTASDNVGVTSVQFKLDGANLGSPLYSPPYQSTWNTTAVANGIHTLTAVASDAAGNLGKSNPVQVVVSNPVATPPPTPTPTPTSGSAATFLKQDGATQGKWKTAYGAEGAMIANDVNSPPAYGQVALTGALTYTWSANTGETSALQNLNGGGIASTWYNATSFSVDVNATGGQAHQIALYLLDYDSAGRTERIDVVDAVTGSVLDSRSPASYSHGVYWVWNISGHVRFNITNTHGANGLVNGIFFGGPAGTTPPPPSPQDTTPPTVSLTAPTSGQTVIGTVSVMALASDNVGVAGVQFKLDGAGLGAEQIAAPFGITWNSATASNGSHTVSAVARDAAGNTATASATVTVSNAVPSGPSGPAPTAYWTLNSADTAGGMAIDKSSNALNLAVSNAPSIPGRVAEAMSFNGSNSMLSIAGGSKLELNSSMTFAAWIRTSNATRSEAILSKYDTSGTEAGYLLKTTAAGTMAFRLGGKNLTSGNPDTVDSTKINDGQWHHVAVVVSLGQTVTFFVDGVQTSSKPCASSIGSSGVTFEVGSIVYPYYAQLFTGSIDEVKVFSSALTPAQVAQLASGN